MGIFLFILGIIFFVCLVLVHEWGHFIVARRNKVDVEEFGLGFPPQAKVLTKKNGTVYSLNWLPLGGFVKLKGEHDQDTRKGTFGAATTWVKTKIMLAGVVMNLLVAILVFTIVALIGMPKLTDNQTTVASDTKVRHVIRNENIVKINEVIKDTPAAAAGIQKGDEIISVAGTEINEPEDLTAATKDNAGKTVTVETQRKGEVKTQEITLNNSSPYLGVGPYSAEVNFEIRRSTWSAPIVGVAVTKDFTIATLKGLGQALSGLGSTFAGLITGNKEARQAGQEAASSQVAGPVGIFTVLYEISKEGVGFVLFIIGIISLTLAIMNVLPIPALDGGRLFVMLLFRALKKPLVPSVEEKIHGTGFAVLMLLFVVITIVDVRRFFL